MGVLACKGFKPGLKCRGYRFRTDAPNVTGHANCARNGFHAAENPLDCLTYYPGFDDNEYWTVWCDGDLNEDGNYSKITCTRMELIERLTRLDFVLLAGMYVAEHPTRPPHGRIRLAGRAVADEDGMAIIWSKHPVARGNRVGDVLLLIEGEPERYVVNMAALEIDGIRAFPDVWYSMDDALGREGGGRHGTQDTPNDG